MATQFFGRLFGLKVPSFMGKNAPIPNDLDDKIKIRKLRAPFWKNNEYAIFIENVYSSSECLELISMSNKYLKYIVPSNEKLRNNSRAMIDSFLISSNIFERIKKYLPSKWNNRELNSLNERLRFLKYKQNQQFLAHFDGEYRKRSGEISYLTLLLYLNDDFNGGETSFIDKKSKNNQYKVKPKTGSILIFQHKHLLHSGSKILSNSLKCCIRTDVMYL